MSQPLTPQAIEQQLKLLNAAALAPWQIARETLQREFKFDDFVRAFAFMTSVAALAEEAGHHPDWSNSYNRVVINLTTHDAGGLTTRDFALAGAIDQIPI